MPMSASECLMSPVRGGSCIRRDLLADDLPMTSTRLSSDVRLAARDVEHLARGARRGAGQQVRLDGVVDVAEVARLLAVAVDGRRAPLQRRRDEVRDDRRVLRLRILARAEDVEVAQRHRLEAVADDRTPAGSTRRPAWPPRTATAASGSMVSTFGSARRLFAVRRRGRREHHALDARLARRVEQRDGAVDVGVDRRRADPRSSAAPTESPPGAARNRCRASRAPPLRRR